MRFAENPSEPQGLEPEAFLPDRGLRFTEDPARPRGRLDRALQPPDEPRQGGDRRGPRRAVDPQGRASLGDGPQPYREAEEGGGCGRPPRLLLDRRSMNP